MGNKIQELCNLITTESQARLVMRHLDCETNMKNYIAHSKDGLKYIKIDVGGSGKLMIEKSTGNIFGIKGYGQIHRGHFYGTLDTIHEWDWSDYYPRKKVVA